MATRTKTHTYITQNPNTQQPTVTPPVTTPAVTVTSTYIVDDIPDAPPRNQ